jgi:hypothetical protein
MADKAAIACDPLPLTKNWSTSYLSSCGEAEWQSMLK